MAKDTPSVGNYAAACEYLKLTRWREAEFGVPDSHRSRMTGAPQPVSRGKNVGSRSVSLI